MSLESGQSQQQTQGLRQARCERRNDALDEPSGYRKALRKLFQKISPQGVVNPKLRGITQLSTLLGRLRTQQFRGFSFLVWIHLVSRESNSVCLAGEVTLKRHNSRGAAVSDVEAPRDASRKEIRRDGGSYSSRPQYSHP